MKTKINPPKALTRRGGVPDLAPHCWRVRVRREVLMKPSLCPHDIAVIDWKQKTCAQGQIVAVECVERSGISGAQEARPFMTFRRRYQLRKGVDVFLSDEKGIIGNQLTYGRWWPVVAIEVDELSPYARASRPEGLRSQLDGAEKIHDLFTNNHPLAPGFGNVARHAEAERDITKIIRRLKAEYEKFYQRWEKPKSGRRIG